MRRSNTGGSVMQQSSGSAAFATSTTPTQAVRMRSSLRKASDIVKRIALSAAVAAAAITVPIATSTALAQDPPCVVNGRQLHVVRTTDRYVSARSVLNYIADLSPNTAINVSYLGGTMWTGAWFTTPNGPEGWRGWVAPSTGGWPAPGATMFSLVGQVFTADSTGTIVQDATDHHAVPLQPCIRATGPGYYGGYGVYDMMVNDNNPWDDTGGFWVRVQELA